MHTLQSIVLYICSNSMQFWQCSILLQFLQIINAKDFAFRSLQNLQSSTSADCTVSLHARVHCNPKCIAVIPLQFHCNYLQCMCPYRGSRGLEAETGFKPALIFEEQWNKWKNLSLRLWTTVVQACYEALLSAHKSMKEN